jgi:hypothetical protein
LSDIKFSFMDDKRVFNILLDYPMPCVSFKIVYVIYNFINPIENTDPTASR